MVIEDGYAQLLRLKVLNFVCHICVLYASWFA